MGRRGGRDQAAAIMNSRTWSGPSVGGAGAGTSTVTNQQTEAGEGCGRSDGQGAKRPVGATDAGTGNVRPWVTVARDRPQLVDGRGGDGADGTPAGAVMNTRGGWDDPVGHGRSRSVVSYHRGDSVPLCPCLGPMVPL
jgi:hypothetical protein